MADIFGNDSSMRGCFTQISMTSSSGLGASLRLPGFGRMPSSFGEPNLVIGFSTSKVDAVTHLKTFGGNVYTYAFGNDPNQSILDVTVAAFIGGDRGVTGDMLASYDDSRVSQSLSKARFVVGNAPAVSGYLVGQSSNTQSPEYNIQVFNYRIALTEL